MKTRTGSTRWMAAFLAAALVGPASVAAQEPQIAGSTVLLAGDIARLELELPSGEMTTVELNTGHVLVDGADVGSYEPGGAFEAAWRDLLRNRAIGEPGQLPELLASWEPTAGEADGTAKTAILGAFDRFDPRRADPAGAAGLPADADVQERVTIVPRAGSIGQLAERLERLAETLDRISGETLGLDGEFALVVHDDYRIAEETVVDGDVALLGGELVVYGRIDGNVLVLGGELDLEPGATVSGDVRSLGGEVETAGALVMGEILSFSDLPEIAAHDVTVDADPSGSRPRHDASEWSRDRDRGFFGSILHNMGHAVGGVFGTAVWILGLTLLGAVLVYVTPNRLEVVAATARNDLLRSFGVGLAGEFLFVPVLVLLGVLIVTWLVIPFYLLAAAVAVPFGYLAVARATGEAVVDRRYEFMDRLNLNRSNTYYYLFNGLLFMLAPFAVASVLYLLGGWTGFIRGLLLFLGVVLAWGAATTGLGAVILTRGGSPGRFRGFRRGTKKFFEDFNLDVPPAPTGEADDE